MSFEEPNNPRSSEIVNNQIQLTELATYEERTPDLCVERNNLTGLLQLMNVWKFKLIFPTDTTVKDRNNGLKPIFLAAENASLLIILATIVFIV